MSLRTRLLVSVAALVVLSLALVGFAATRITSVELNRLAASEEKRRLETELSSLAEVLEASEPARWTATVGAWRGSLDALLFAPSGDLAAASDPRYFEAHLRPGERGIEGELTEDGEAHRFKLVLPQRGLRDGSGRHRLYLLPPLYEDQASAASRFQASASRWTLLLVAMLGTVALLVATTVAGRLAGPLEDLTAALREGDLSRRLEVRGDDEIARLTAAFNGLAEGIERADRLRRTMVTDVAHELRTPLTNLRGEIESLEDGLLEPSPAVLASLREEVVHLQRLVEDLQELALAEAGALRLEPEPVDLGAEVASVVRGFESADRPELSVSRARGWVLAEPRRLRQILINLIDNACRHTPSGGLVEVSAGLDTDHVTVRVADGGPGIPAEHRGDVFERFVRLDGSRRRSTGGAGLGLAITRHWVEAHGGRIWIEDPVGGSGGAVFAFTVPRADGPAQAGSEKAAPAAAARR